MTVPVQDDLSLSFHTSQELLPTSCLRDQYSAVQNEVPASPTLQTWAPSLPLTARSICCLAESPKVQPLGPQDSTS